MLLFSVCVVLDIRIIILRNVQEKVSVFILVLNRLAEHLVACKLATALRVVAVLEFVLKDPVMSRYVKTLVGLLLFKSHVWFGICVVEGRAALPHSLRVVLPDARDYLLSDLHILH